MTIYKEFKVGGGNSPFGFLGPLIILAIFFTLLFYMAKGVFWLLTWAAPVLLIATLIMDYTIVTDFFKFLWKLLKENTFLGILAVVLTFFGFPIVSGYLFFKALSRKKLQSLQDRLEKERNSYSDYEEVVEEDESFLELPQINKKHAKITPIVEVKNKDDYDEFFK
jgi:hypothetical protein